MPCPSRPEQRRRRCTAVRDDGDEIPPISSTRYAEVVPRPTHLPLDRLTRSTLLDARIAREWRARSPGGTGAAPAGCSQQAAARPARAERAEAALDRGSGRTRTDTADGNGSRSEGALGSGTSPGSALGQQTAPSAMRNRADQSLAVGMERHSPQGRGRRGLDHHAEVHHRDIVCDVAHDRQIVRDQEKAQVELDARAVRAGSRVAPAPTHRATRAARRARYRRIGGQRPRDRDSLPLTS